MAESAPPQASAVAYDPERRIPVVVLEKPRFGQPCNGCGLCCIEEVCALGRQLGDDKVCRALIGPVDGRYSCGLVAEPYRFARDADLAMGRSIDELGDGSGENALRSMYMHLLGAGKGCDSED